jgi:L-2-hydroxyglutarate oxidase LhgO
MHTSTTVHIMAGPMTDMQKAMQSNGAEGRDRVVIIGGGIVGLSTAYSLALARKEQLRNSPHITVIESSDKLCPAASSQATGGLGDFGNGNGKTGVAGVSTLSYEIHVQLAKDFNGAERYGFGRQVSWVRRKILKEFS